LGQGAEFSFTLSTEIEQQCESAQATPVSSS
jgi:hypothetical protein